MTTKSELENGQKIGKKTKSLIKYLLQTFYGKWDFLCWGDERDETQKKEQTDRQTEIDKEQTDRQN